MNLKNTKGQKAAECTRDGRSGIEYGQPSCQLTTAVECSLIIDDKGEKGTLGHAQEPPNGQKAAKVHDSNNHDSHESESCHHEWQHTGWTILLACNTQKWRSKDIGDKENAQKGVILVASEVKRLFQSSGLCVAKVGLVQCIEKVHDGQDGEDVKIELPNKPSLGSRVKSDAGGHHPIMATNCLLNQAVLGDHNVLHRASANRGPYLLALLFRLHEVGRVVRHGWMST